MTEHVPADNLRTADANMDALDRRDQQSVRRKLRNTITEAIELLAKRKASKATLQDMVFEDQVWELIQKHFKPGLDYTGGKQEKTL